MNIGILGHVDAGKTTLAKTLSTFGSTAAFDKGAKSSNLRANTIDLGFSALQIDESRKIALIDCPGHAQLTNAVLVASSVFDGAIVVISSVRGIEPQTAEHLILVSILCPEKVIIVLSKIDLVEPLKVELLKKKLPKLLKSLKIKEDSPIIPLDLSEEGKKESVNELIEVLRSFPVPDRVSSGKFVMAVDHCFPIKGKGSVMTGTVVDGSCKVGSEIEIPIIGEKRKVKEIQSWKKSVPEVKIGERAAILFGNLQKTENIDRILIFEPGGMTSGKVALITVQRIEQFKGSLKNRSKIHFFSGFETVMAECSFLKSESEQPEEFSEKSEFEQLEEFSEHSSHVLVNFQRKINIRKNQICLGAKLDSQKLSECRFAFHGFIVSISESLEKLPFEKFIRKEKKGFIERWDKDDCFICDGLLKKESSIDIFSGMTVSVDGGKFIGKIEGFFGKSGKIRIQVRSGSEELKERLKKEKPISSTSLVFAKKRKRPQKGKERPEVVEVDDDDDPDDVVDEKTALAARGILHMGIGEPEEVVDDGLPKDYKRRVLKLGSRRLDTLLNRTSGKSSAEVEKMILTGKVRVNEQVVKKKAYNVMKRDEVDVWIEELEENPNFANIHRVKIIDYVLKQHGYDIDSLIWQKMLVENWRRDQENLSGAGFTGLDKKRAFDSLIGTGFTGMDKRAFDTVMGSGFTGFDRRRRAFDMLYSDSFNGMDKRAFDSLVGSFSGLDKRAFDSLVGSFSGLDKRSRNGLDTNVFSQEKRAFDSLDGGFTGFD
ncbi:hypothetical protein FO519_009206 [Halicephalobus sp. NKZ332]|nr:hypothetical protein FO519_009206 [Halicephalobus sp. NKZ332]